MQGEDELDACHAYVIACNSNFMYKFLPSSGSDMHHCLPVQLTLQLHEQRWVEPRLRARSVGSVLECIS